jgi:hypothetical protein
MVGARYKELRKAFLSKFCFKEAAMQQIGWNRGLTLVPMPFMGIETGVFYLKKILKKVKEYGR